MRKRMIWSLLLAVYVGFMYVNSLTPADISSHQSGTVLQVVTGVMNAVGLGNVGVTEHIIRKMAHFGEYTVFGILLVQCLAQYELPRVSRWQLHGLAGFLVPFVDETLQLFTEGRSGQISDVWLDCSGVLFGTMAVLGWGLWRQRRKSRKAVKQIDGGRKGKRNQKTAGKPGQ